MAASGAQCKPNQLDPDPANLGSYICTASLPHAAVVAEMDGRGRPGEISAAPQPSAVTKLANDGARQKTKKNKKKNKKKLGMKGADSGTAVPSASSSNRDSEEDNTDGSSDLDEDYSDDEDEGTEGYKKGQI